MRRIDLNLLYILRELLKEPNTTRVGEKMGLTQSAVSASLGRLRYAFQDDLLVRSGRRMLLTRRAESLLDPIEDIIESIESLAEDVRFEPAELEKNFTLVSPDLVIESLSDKLIAAVSSEAPNTRVTFSCVQPDTFDRMRSGHLDLIIGAIEPTVSKVGSGALQSKASFTDRLVVVARADTGKYGGSISLEDFQSSEFLEYSPALGTVYGQPTKEIGAGLGIKLKAAGEFTSLSAMLYGLRSADVLAVVPHRQAQRMSEQLALEIMELPFEWPEFNFGMIWNSAFDADPEHQWFRGIVEAQLDRL
ncbi:MAG: LysR family transcriptional regulator [Pseudomonadota bacterium]